MWWESSTTTDRPLAASGSWGATAGGQWASCLEPSALEACRDSAGWQAGGGKTLLFRGLCPLGLAFSSRLRAASRSCCVSSCYRDGSWLPPPGLVVLRCTLDVLLRTCSDVELRATWGSCLEETWWDLVMVKSCGCGPETRMRGSVQDDTSLPPTPGPQETRSHSRRTEPASPGVVGSLPGIQGSGANTLPVVPGLAALGGLGEPPVLSLLGCRTGVTRAAPRPAPGREVGPGLDGPSRSAPPARSAPRAGMACGSFSGGLSRARSESVSCGPLLAPAPRLYRPHLLPEEAFLTQDQPTGYPVWRSGKLGACS